MSAKAQPLSSVLLSLGFKRRKEGFITPPPKEDAGAYFFRNKLGKAITWAIDEKGFIWTKRGETTLSAPRFRRASARNHFC